nr:immunoglobulin heavy chain junction region [Mus musculus]
CARGLWLLPFDYW